MCAHNSRPAVAISVFGCWDATGIPRSVWALNAAVAVAVLIVC